MAKKSKASEYNFETGIVYQSQSKEKVKLQTRKGNPAKNTIEATGIRILEKNGTGRRITVEFLGTGTNPNPQRRVYSEYVERMVTALGLEPVEKPVAPVNAENTKKKKVETTSTEVSTEPLTV